MKASASRAELLERCQHWLGLEEDGVDSERATTGRKIHAALERRSSFPIVLTAEDAGVWHTSLRGLPNPTLGATQLRAEVAFDYVDGAVVSGPRNRDYQGMFGGTADLVWVADRTLHVLDWKSGLAPPPDCGQLKALGALAFLALDDVDVRSVRLWVGAVRSSATEQGVLRSVPAEPRELCEYLERLVALATAQGRPTPGMHCRKCPALLGCYATQKLLHTVHGLHGGEDLDSEATIRFWARSRGVVARIAESLDELLKARLVRDGPLTLSDGTRLEAAVNKTGAVRIREV